MRISRKGLYALQAMISLASSYPEQTMTTRDIAGREGIPEKFLELILAELKNARLVDSQRGSRGGYRLARSPAKIFLGEIIRLIDGPLAPLGNAASLRRLVARDKRHSPLYRVFLDVRNATSNIIDHTSLADLCREGGKR
ncbi:MAG: Rrf2 family transcriptional regulator [Acidobacteriaceae bacterium]